MTDAIEQDLAIIERNIGSATTRNWNESDAALTRIRAALAAGKAAPVEPSSGDACVVESAEEFACKRIPYIREAADENIDLLESVLAGDIKRRDAAMFADGKVARDEGPLGHVETVKRIARYVSEQAGDRSLANMVIDDEAAFGVKVKAGRT